jgi:RNA polymerase sigma-70 factor (ECF subfamily)
LADDPDDRLAAVWHEHRPHLLNVAFRILRDVGAAEDAVQEAFARLLRTTPGTVEDERAWLIVVTSRICVDRLRSASARHTDVVAPEQFAELGAAGTVDPADRVTLDDRVGQALQSVLQRLSPAERVVFVLHDVFRVPFDDIAATVGRPPSTCRQLATRARRRIAGMAPSAAAVVTPADTGAVADAFLVACARGDLAGLLALLDPDVSGDGDFGPGIPVPPVARGAGPVATRTLAFLGRGATVVTHPGPQPPDEAHLLVYRDRRLLALVELTIVGDRVVHLHARGGEAALAAVTAALAERS